MWNMTRGPRSLRRVRRLAIAAAMSQQRARRRAEFANRPRPRRFTDSRNIVQKQLKNEQKPPKKPFWKRLAHLFLAIALILG